MTRVEGGWNEVVPTHELTDEMREWATRDAPMIEGLPYEDDLGRPPSAVNPNVPSCWAKLKRGRMGTFGDGRCHDMCMHNGVRYTRCKRHGGAISKTMKTGQHSKLVGRRIFELAAAMENDTELTAIEEQVKLAAALFKEYVAGLNKAECEWMAPEELDKALDRLEKLSRLTERRHKIREGNLYTVRTEHVILVVHAVADVINTELADHPDLRDRIAKRIGQIRVIEGQARPAKAVNA